MVTSSDDYLTCLSQIWSRYEAFHSKMSRLSKVTLLNESTFVIKVSRWFKWSCLFFRDAEWGIWSLSASQKCSYSVLENELFISVFSSELRVCVIIRAGCRSSMRLEYRLKCVSIASRIENTQVPEAAIKRCGLESRHGVRLRLKSWIWWLYLD